MIDLKSLMPTAEQIEGFHLDERERAFLDDILESRITPLTPLEWEWLRQIEVRYGALRAAGENELPPPPRKALSPEQYELYRFEEEEWEHFEACVKTNTPSPRLVIDDPEENLKMCRQLEHYYSENYYDGWVHYFY
jgi:hypothetical protein